MATLLRHFLNCNFVSCFPSKSFISSSEISTFDCVVQSDILVAFWILVPLFLYRPLNKINERALLNDRVENGER